MSNNILTIGHSNRSEGEFVKLLKDRDVKVLADVRSFPSSKKNPQFNAGSLKSALESNGISYVQLPLLGGRRKGNPESTNIRLTHPSFRSYADYMETPEFKVGVSQLLDLAKKDKVAIMCSEAVWWRCHRGMISDYLKSIGHKPVHIISSNPAKDLEHPYTIAANLVDGKLSYKGD